MKLFTAFTNVLILIPSTNYLFIFVFLIYLFMKAKLYEARPLALLTTIKYENIKLLSLNIRYCPFSIYFLHI